MLEETSQVIRIQTVHALLGTMFWSLPPLPSKKAINHLHNYCKPTFSRFGCGKGYQWWSSAFNSNWWNVQAFSTWKVSWNLTRISRRRYEWLVRMGTDESGIAMRTLIEELVIVTCTFPLYFSTSIKYHWSFVQLKI